MLSSTASPIRQFFIAFVFLLFLSGCHNSNSKVTFCHHPPGNPENPSTMTVKVRALRGVINEEYDYEGPCRAITSPTGQVAAATPDPDECAQGMRCGEFNYTYGVADNPESDLEGQLYEISTTFESVKNSERKLEDTGNDPNRFETGTEIEKVNTDYAEKNGLPTGKNIYHGVEVNAVILGE